MRWMLMLLLFLLIGAALPAHNPSLVEAQRLYAEGKYDAAIKLLNTLIEDKEAQYEALKMMGDCYQKDEKFVAAIQMYEKAGKINGESAPLNAHHGAALLNLQQYNEAEKRLKKALKIDAELPEAHYFMGNLKYFEYNTNAALKHYNEAIRLRPEYRDALYMRAATYAEMGKYKPALRDYESTLAIDPNLQVARYNIAVILLNDDQYQKAADMLEQMDPARLPSPADFYFSLAEALYFSGKREEACEYYKEAMDLGDPESKTIYMRYCLNKEERDAFERTRTIRMAF